jgi:hypothetical protein
MTAVEHDDKIRENRLRRMAARQGLRVTKSRRRDPRALDYGKWRVVDARNMLQGPEQGMTLDELERFLTG